MDCSTCWKLLEDGNVLIVLWESSCPHLNEFYRKRHLMDYPQCKINLFPEFRTNYLPGLRGRSGEMCRH